MINEAKINEALSAATNLNGIMVKVGKSIIEPIIEAGAGLDNKDVLNWASEHGYDNIVKMQINGAKFTVGTLNYALRNCLHQPQSVKLLLEAGANPSHRKNYALNKCKELDRSESWYGCYKQSRRLIEAAMNIESK